MSVTIRLRREEDIPDLAGILVRVHELDGYPVEGVADPEAWLRHDHELQSWTALNSDEPVGQITLTRADPNDEAAQLWQERTGGAIGRLAIPARLFIDPRRRRIGAGGLLMNTAVDYARSQDLAIAFDVMLKDQAAIRLYESLGAVRIAYTEHRHSAGRTEPAAVYAISKPMKQ